MKYKLIIKKNLNQQIIWTGSGSTIWIALFASGHYQLNITWDHPDIFPSLTSLLIVASSLHVLTFSTLCLGRFLIRRIYGAYHSRGTYFTFNIFKTLPKRSGCHAIAAGNYLHVTRSHTASWLRDGGSSCTECERRFEKRYWLSFN